MTDEIEVKLPEHNVALSSYIRRSGDRWLLCLHGIQTNKILFSNLLNNPDFNQYSFLCPDFVGFGDSTGSENFTYDLHQQLEAIVLMLDHLKIDRVSVVGHSLGGMVGTMMLRDIPDRISALCSIEGNLRLDDCSASRDASDLSLEKFETDGYPDLISSIKSLQAPSREIRLEALKKVSAQVFYKTSRSIVEYSNDGQLFDVFSNSNIPRILIVGQKSSFTSRPSGEDLKIVEVSNAGHFVPLDNPAQFEKELENFLIQQ